MFEFPAKVKNGVSKRIADVNVKPFEPSEFTVSRKELTIHTSKTIAVHESHYTIYEAEYRGSVVAVKMVSLDEEKHTSDFIDTIVDLTCLAALPHDNIAAFYGAGHAVHPETKLREIFIVMETFEKGTLRQVLRKVLDWETKITLGRDIARALAFLHSKQMIHGDVRASTVLVNEEMQAKLVDCSHLCGERSRLEVRTFNTNKGTVALSPEMARNQIYTYSADVYAFGMMLFEIITEQAPSKTFRYRDAKANFALLDKELRAAVRPGCPDALEALAYSCCATRAAQRITSDQIVEELDFLLIALNRKTNNTRLTAAASSPQLVNRSKYTHLLLPSPPSWKGTPLRSAASDSGHAGGSFDVTPYIVGVKAPLTERAKVPLLERMNSLSSTLDVSEGLPEVDETGSSDDSDDDVPVKENSAETSHSAGSTPPEKAPIRVEDVYSPATPLRAVEQPKDASTPPAISGDSLSSVPAVPAPVAAPAPAPAAPVRSTAKSLFAEVSSPAPTTKRTAKTVHLTTAPSVMAPPARSQAMSQPAAQAPAAPAESASKQVMPSVEVEILPVAAVAKETKSDTTDPAVDNHTESTGDTSASDASQPLETTAVSDKKSQRRKPLQAGDQAVVTVNADEALALIRNIKHIVSDARMLSDVPEPEADVLLSAAASFTWEHQVAKSDASTSTPSSPPQDAPPAAPTSPAEAADVIGSVPTDMTALPIEGVDGTVESVLAMESAPVQLKKNRRKGKLDYSAEAAEVAPTTDAAADATPVLPVEPALSPAGSAQTVPVSETVVLETSPENGLTAEVKFVDRIPDVISETVVLEAEPVSVEAEVQADVAVAVVPSADTINQQAPGDIEAKPADAVAVQVPVPVPEIGNASLQATESEVQVKDLIVPVTLRAPSPPVIPAAPAVLRVLDDMLATGRADAAAADSSAVDKAGLKAVETAAEKSAEKAARKKLKKDKSLQSLPAASHPVIVQGAAEPLPVPLPVPAALPVLSQHVAFSAAPISAKSPVVSQTVEPTVVPAILSKPASSIAIKSSQPDLAPVQDNKAVMQQQNPVAIAAASTPAAVVSAASVKKEVAVSPAPDNIHTTPPVTGKADARVPVQPSVSSVAPPAAPVQQSTTVAPPPPVPAPVTVPIVTAPGPAYSPAATAPALVVAEQSQGDGAARKKSPRKRNRNKGKSAMNSSSASLLSVGSDDGDAPVSTTEEAATIVAPTMVEVVPPAAMPTTVPPPPPSIVAATPTPPTIPTVSVAIAPSVAMPSVVAAAPPVEEVANTQDSATEEARPTSGNQKRRLRREKARTAVAAFTSATDQAQVVLNGSGTSSLPTATTPKVVPAPAPAAPALAPAPVIVPAPTTAPVVVQLPVQAPVIVPPAPVVAVMPTVTAPPPLPPVPAAQLVPPVAAPEGRKSKKDKKTAVPAAAQQQTLPAAAPAATAAPVEAPAPVPVVKVEPAVPVPSSVGVPAMVKPDVTVVIPARTNIMDAPNSAVSTATTAADDTTPIVTPAPLSSNNIPAYEDRLAAMERMLLSLAQENLALHRELRDVSKPVAPQPTVPVVPSQEYVSPPPLSAEAPAVVAEEAPTLLSSAALEQPLDVSRDNDVDVEGDVVGGGEDGDYDDASDSTESQHPSESEGDSELDGDSDSEGDQSEGEEISALQEAPMSTSANHTSELEFPAPAAIAPAGVMEVLKYLESMQADLLAQLSALQHAPPAVPPAALVEVTPSTPVLTEGTPSRSLLADTLLQESIVTVLDSRLGAVQLQMSQFAAILQDLVISQSPPRTIHAGPSSHENSQVSTHSSAFVTPNSGTLASTTETEDFESLSEIVEPRHLFSQIDQQAEPPQLQLQVPSQHIDAALPSAPISDVPHSVGEVVAETHVAAPLALRDTEPTAQLEPVITPLHALPEEVLDGSSGAEDVPAEVFSPVSPMEEALPMEESGGEVHGSFNVDEIEEPQPVDAEADETVDEQADASPDPSEVGETEVCCEATIAAPVSVAETAEKEVPPVPAEAARHQQLVESSESEGEVWERKAKTAPAAQPAASSAVFAPRRSRAVTPVSTLDTAGADGFPVLLSADGSEPVPIPSAPQHSPVLSLKLPAVGGLQSVLRAAMDQHQQHTLPAESDEEPMAQMPQSLFSHRDAVEPASDKVGSQFQRASNQERSRKDHEVSSDSSMVDVADIEYPYTRDEWEQRQHNAPAAILQLHQHHEQQQRDMLLLQQQQLQEELDTSYPYRGAERIQAQSAQSRTTPTLHLHHVGVVPYVSANQPYAEAPLTPSSKVFNSSMRFLDEIGKLKDQMDARDGVQSSPALPQSQLRSTSRPSSRQDYSALHQSPGELRHAQSGQPDLSHSNGDGRYFQNGRKTPPETRTAWDSETGRFHTQPHPHLQSHRHDYPQESSFGTHEQHHHSASSHGQSPFGSTAHRFTPEPVGFHNAAPSRSRSPQQPQLHVPQLIASVPRNTFQSPSPAHAVGSPQIGTHSSLTNASRDHSAARQTASPTRAAELMTPQRILDLTGALNSFLKVIEKCSEITDSADLAVSQLDHNMDKLEQRSRRNLLASAEKLVSSTSKRDGDAASLTSRGNISASFRVPNATGSVGQSATKAPQLPRTDTFYDAQYVEEFDDSDDGNNEQKSLHSQHTQRSQPSARTRDLPRSRSNSNLNASVSNTVNNNVFDSKSTIKREPVHTKHFLSPSTKPALPKISRSSSKQLLSSPSFRNGDITSSSNYFKSPEPMNVPRGSVSIQSATSGTASASKQTKTLTKPLRKEPEPVESHRQGREARTYSFASTIGTCMSGDASSVNGSISASIGVRKEEVYPVQGHPSLVRTSSRVMIDGKETVIKSGPSTGSSGGGGNGVRSGNSGGDSVTSPADAPRGRSRSNSATSHLCNRSNSRSHSPGRSSSPHKQGSPKEILSKHLNHTSYSFRIENQPRKVF